MNRPIISGRDFVIVSLQPWYFKIGNNAKDIAFELAKHNRVLYVNLPIKRMAYYAKQSDPNLAGHIDIIRKKSDKLEAITENLWQYYPSRLIESINGLPTTGLHRIFNYVNNRRFARDIKEACRQLGFKDIIFINDNDIYNGYYLKELLKPSKYIYYFRDFLQGFAYWKKHVSVLEPELIRKSDLIVANSSFYTDYSLQYNKNAYYIGQGCNFQHFDNTRTFQVPDDIGSLPRPLIGYVGAINSSRLDPAIIAIIAKAYPGGSVVMVGPEDEPFTQSILHQVPNVHFLGGKPFEQLAAYVNAFDVCINPQLQNEVTQGNYPLKVDEYLAMGKPVVATRTPAMSVFAEHTYLADKPEQYPGLIAKALSEDDPSRHQQRIGFARSHTWENVVGDLYEAILKK